MYAISVRIERTSIEGWRSGRDLPTFYLDERVQGIVSEDQAVAIARDIVGPDDDEHRTKFYVTAVKL